MPLIFTPRQFTLRAHFYQQFGQLLSAGLPILNALDMMSRNPPAASYREPLKKLHASLVQGITVTEAVTEMGDWMPAFDVALVSAGEHSGRLDAVLKLLANYYNDRAAMLRRLIGDLAYPLFIFHFAIILFPFISWFSNSNTGLFLLRTLGVFVPLYLGVFLIIKAMQGKRSVQWRSSVERLLHPIPVLGNARQSMALSRLSAALEALLNAGVGIFKAWEMAALASGSPALVRAVESWKMPIESGKTPSEMVNSSSQFPELFANLYHSGEISGQLDDSLVRLRDYYQEEGSRKMHALSKWVPQGIYLMVALFIAYKIITFYLGYFDQVRQAGGL